MSDWKVRPRSEVEELVTTFVVENKMSAYYGKDTEGVFVVKFMVEEEPVSRRIGVTSASRLIWRSWPGLWLRHSSPRRWRRCSRIRPGPR